MSIAQEMITIGMVVLGTMLTRFLPFLVFPDNKPIPKYVQYLGKVLPFSVIGLLIVYCLKGVSFITPSYGLPEIISIGAVIGMHRWKRNMLLSIAAGTILYMILVQAVF